jgi:hypothetical protein
MLAVIHDPAHRGFRIGGNLYQIQFLGLCNRKRLSQSHDTQLLSLFINQAHLLRNDLVIDAGAFLAALSAFLLNVANLRFVNLCRALPNFTVRPK